MRSTKTPLALLLLTCATACVDPLTLEDPDTDATPTTGGEPSAPSTSAPDPDSGSGDPDGTGSSGSTTGEPEPACTPGDPGCTSLVDLVFVIDNSGTMGEEQLALARSFPRFVEQLRTLSDAEGTPLQLDVQVMVTTTDNSNPVCTQFEPPGYDPAMGSPVETACTDRLSDFTSFNGIVSIPEACTNLCPVGVAPDDPFVAFDAEGSNVPGAPVDIDGDGTLDSPAAQALACVGPQGIIGCGYESPLESMLLALDPGSPWNQGERPFLRDGATVGIVLVSDELDCSIEDLSIMDDPAYQNIDPDSGMPELSSAICWNAGVSCTDQDADGVYASCASDSARGLFPVARYIDYLVDELRGDQGKEVFMLGITGIPLVQARSPEPPYAPTAGGLLDLVYRDWQDGQYPEGDILPEDVMMGETAADKQYDFGIGPGCTGQDQDGTFTGQAIPPVRMVEVCQALDLDDSAAGTRCCMESICDGDYSGAIDCLAGLVSLTTVAPDSN